MEYTDIEELAKELETRELLITELHNELALLDDYYHEVSLYIDVFPNREDIHAI